LQNLSYAAYALLHYCFTIRCIVNWHCQNSFSSHWILVHIGRHSSTVAQIACLVFVRISHSSHAACGTAKASQASLNSLCSRPAKYVLLCITFKESDSKTSVAE